MISILASSIDLSSCPVPIPPSILKLINSEEIKETKYESIHESTFKLPIQYLDEKYIHPISPIVSQDLELVSSTNKSMYDILLNPSNPFANHMIEKWSSQFTSHIPFLKDTQNVLQEHKIYKEKMSENQYKVDYNIINEIWKSTKEDPYFLEHYSYMEFDFLKYLNHSSSFLQSLSVIHLISPVTTFLIPIFLLIIPFFILKIQGIPIGYNEYISVLTDIAKHHFIGKTITSLQNISFSSISYLFITIGFYFLQIYQNVVSLFRFYRNMSQIKRHLYEMKQYVSYSIESMSHFVEINKNRCYYYEFCKDIYKNLTVLEHVKKLVENIHNTDVSLLSVNDFGYLLKCYYVLHENPEFDESLRFSFSFEGYINNLNGLYENIELKVINSASFNKDEHSKEKQLNEEKEPDSETSCSIVNQYYPPSYKEKHVKNDCHLDKNMIITGVNASGKTTYLKTTTINIIFTQQFGYGFYDSFQICPYTHIHSYLNIPDTSGRDSLFQAESRRCKEIIDIIGNNKEDVENRHFCIFDELYSGTNPIEASKSAYAFLLYLSGFKNVDFILTTHYTSVCKKITEKQKMRNYKMNVKRTEEGKLKYTYKIKEGICHIKGAFEILKSMDYPQEILDNM